MKIKSLILQDYKRFRSKKIFNFDSDITLIVGENGSGKTSILQAIASLIGSATETIKKPSILNWSGFEYELIGIESFPKVIASIEFSEKELSSVAFFHQKMKDLGKKVGVKPDRQNKVEIGLNYDKDEVFAENNQQLAQFKGYSFVKQLAPLNPTKSHFEQVGSIFWYSADRNNSSFRNFTSAKKNDSLRNFLISRYRFHQRVKNGEIALKEDQRDIYEELANLYTNVFGDRHFLGSEPRIKAEDAFETDWFFLSDGENKYEIAEMSAGENAIFPILVDFANLRINNSIILIDEIELHLHSPLQQGFLRTLRKLGKNNQFIITTHSDSIVSITDESHIIRL